MLIKTGVIHTAVGKASFSAEQLVENVSCICEHYRCDKATVIEGTLHQRDYS